MKKILKVISIFFLITAILKPNINLIAQDTEGDYWDMVEGARLNINGVKSGELAKCSDIYKSSNIVFTVGINKSLYKASDTVEIRGNISNNNPYPIIDATIKARILRSHPNLVDKAGEYIIVDDKVIQKNINLKANENYSFEYTYFVPMNAPSGEYIIQYYIYNQDRFNLSGLSPTGDIVGNSTKFNVEGGKQYIYLDNTNITIGGKEYDNSIAISDVKENQKIPVKIPLINPESEAKNIEVQYKLYKTDDLLEGNLLEDKIQQISVPANGKIDLEYIIETTTEPVYYLVITTNALGELETDAFRTRTMSHIKLSFEGKNRPIINWVGLDKYPFQKGEEIRLFTCLSNILYKIDKNEFKLRSVVKDSKNKELTSIEYTGEIVPSISGLMNKFIANTNYIDKITIETSLYDANDSLLDSLTTIYDCNELSPEICTKDNSIIDNNNIVNYIIGIIMVILLIGVGLLLFRKFKKIK